MGELRRVDGLSVGPLAFGGRVGVCLLVACAMLAGQASGTHGAVVNRPRTEAAAFAQERGVSVVTARRRLGWQRQAPQLIELARRRLGSAFGGVWVSSAPDGHLKLGVVAGRQPDGAAVRDVIDASGLNGAVDVTAVSKSISDLEAVMRGLAAELRAANRDGGSAVALELRVDLNAVRVLLPEEALLTRPQRVFVARAKRLYGGLIRTAPHMGHLVAQACSYPFCTLPLRAGVKVGPAWTWEPHYPSYDGMCTGGFIARGRWPDPNTYQLTAGHCALSDVWGTKTGSSTAPWRAIGDWQDSYRGWSGDVGKYRVADEAYWSARAWVYRPGTSDAYPIYGKAEPVQGQTVCISGAAQGYSNCGTITATSYAATFEGVTMDLVRTSYCSTYGDSGAPVYANNLALGVHTGGYPPCEGFFTRIRNAETVMNVEMRTDAPAPVCSSFDRSRIKMGDMNGDGRADIYRFTDPADGISAGYVWLSNGESFAARRQIGTGFGLAYQDRMADMDGDGDDDVLQFSDDGRLDKWNSNRTSYSSLGQIGSAYGGSCETRIGDMNGDGKDDIFRFTNDGYGYAWISSGTGYSYIGQIGTGFGRSDEDVLGDMNGDGYDDIFQITHEGNAYAWLSDGRSSYSSLGLIGTGFGSSTEVRVGDRDGDGDEDLYRFSDAGNGYYWRSNGRTYTYVGQFTSGFGPSVQVRIADINGDRKADILEFTGEGIGYAWLGDGTGYRSLGSNIGTEFGAP